MQTLRPFATRSTLCQHDDANVNLQRLANDFVAVLVTLPENQGTRINDVALKKRFGFPRAGEHGRENQAVSLVDKSIRESNGCLGYVRDGLWCTLSRKVENFRLLFGHDCIGQTHWFVRHIAGLVGRRLCLLLVGGMRHFSRTRSSYDRQEPFRSLVAVLQNGQSASRTLVVRRQVEFVGDNINGGDESLP